MTDTRAVPLTGDLHVPDGRRLPGGEGRHGAVRLHDVRAGHRRSELRDGQQAVQRLPAGRLARSREREAPLRLPLRRVLLSGGQSRTRRSRTRRVQGRHQQLRPAPRRRLDARRQEGPGDPREHRHHVRPAAARGLRERDPAERAAGTHDVFGATAPASARPRSRTRCRTCRPARCCRRRRSSRRTRT